MGKECKGCGKMNHFQSVCRSSPKKSASLPFEKKELHSVRICAVFARSVPTIKVDLTNSESGDTIANVTAVPDSGAQVTVAGLDILRKIGGDVNNILRRGEDFLVAANGLSLESAGRLDLNIRYRGTTITTTVIICPEHDGMLLSWFVCQELGILPKNYPEPIYARIDTIESPAVIPSSKTCQQLRHLPSEINHDQIPEIRKLLYQEFVDVFDTSGPLRPMTDPPMRIDLNENAIPFAVNGARPIPIAQRGEVKQMLNSMVEEGVIVPVSSPSEWTHPLVVVTKPNGK